MCNAWNHSPSCRCGWGGDGHLGTGGVLRSESTSVREARTVLFAGDSYVIDGVLRVDHGPEGFCKPTTCPQCGSDVFFVRHNGGSVWFEHLGWPWEKHGCFEALGDRHSAHISRSLRESLRDATSNRRPVILAVVTTSDISTSVLGRGYTILCADGGTRRLTLSSDHSQSLITGRFGVFDEASRELILVHPLYRVRIAAVERIRSAIAAPETVVAVDVQPSVELAAIVGRDRKTRSEIVRLLWEYVQQHGCIDQFDRRKVACDERLYSVFKMRDVNVAELEELLQPHLLV
jgi:hypothetical protein